MSSSKKMCDSTDLSELSREELYSVINQLKEENWNKLVQISLLKTELNEFKNKSKKCQSKKRLKSSGSEALDRQTVNKRLCLRSNALNRQSFSARICDDLCEEILQCLSLEDKLKLEGVSKQFQRTIFKKHKALTIDANNSKVRNKDKNLYIEHHFLDLKSLEVLLKKCPKLKSIDLRNAAKSTEMFHLITKYREDNGLDMYVKYGSRHYEGDEHRVEKCVDTFPTLTHFYLWIKSHNESAIHKSLEFISNLKSKRLIHFNLDYICIDCNQNNIEISDIFKRMAINWPKLKSFAIRLRITKNSDLKQLLSPFEAFPALKRLYLRLSGDLNAFSFEAFKGLSKLTHLTLRFGWGSKFKESILKDIDINLPNLQYLVIENRFDLNREEVTQMTDILSRLSKLYTLKLDLRLELKNMQILSELREKCKNLRNFETGYYYSSHNLFSEEY